VTPLRDDPWRYPGYAELPAVRREPLAGREVVRGAAGGESVALERLLSRSGTANRVSTCLPTTECHSHVLRVEKRWLTRAIPTAHPTPKECRTAGSAWYPG
jgi:hypothetical protein